MLLVKERLLKLLKNSAFTYDPINDLQGNTTLGIRIPTHIVTKIPTKSGYRLDNLRSRREGMKEDGKLGEHTHLFKGLVRSPGMAKLHEQAMVSGIYLKYEVPVFIDRQELWEECNKEVGSNRESQNYFSIDAVTPNGYPIEVDGEQHYDENGELVAEDRARDLYLLRRYWIEVKRFRKYQNNSTIGLSMIKEICNLPITGCPFMTNYDEVIWDSFYRRDILTKKALDILVEGKEYSENRKVQEKINEILGMIKKEGN